MERLLDASPERVYRAWSDPEPMSSWFAPSVEGSLAVGTRSILVWASRRVWLDMLEAEPARRIRFRWAPSTVGTMATEVTVEILPHGYGTRLTLHDGPFDVNHPAGLDLWAEAIESWADTLANLRAQLDFSVDLRRRA